MEKIQTKIEIGDCLDILKEYPDNYFDLIITSPPYADSRAKTYGGVKPEKYVEWFLHRSKEFLRVLKPSGTFILNIKEKVDDGERHTNVIVPMGDWAKTRLKTLGKNDVIRFNSKVGSGFGKNISNWVGRTMAYPSNVLHLATETSNKNHSATFPRLLPEWFIRLFTKENDCVLDPFLGSGTTCEVAKELRRNSIGIEILPEYVKIAKESIKEKEYSLFEKRGKYECKIKKSHNKVYRTANRRVSSKTA